MSLWLPGGWLCTCYNCTTQQQQQQQFFLFYVLYIIARLLWSAHAHVLYCIIVYYTVCRNCLWCPENTGIPTTPPPGPGGPLNSFYLSRRDIKSVHFTWGVQCCTLYCTIKSFFSIIPKFLKTEILLLQLKKTNDNSRKLRSYGNSR